MKKMEESESVYQLDFLPAAALFSQVALLAAVLTLVPIIIMSIIILIAVWRKVRRPPADVITCKQSSKIRDEPVGCLVSRARLLYVVRSLAMRSDGR